MTASVKHAPAFEDFDVNVKFKLSALWIVAMFCYVYGDILSLFAPGRIQSMIDGRMGIGAATPVKLLGAAIVMTVPAAMVFLSVSLRPRLNRWLNVAVGAVYSLMMLVISVSSRGEWKMFYVFLGLTEVLITLLIVRYAWTWPKVVPPRQSGHAGVSPA